MILRRNHEIERLYMEQIRNAVTAVDVLSKKVARIDREIKRLNTPIAKESMPDKPDIKYYCSDSGIWFLPILLLIFVLIVFGLIKFLLSAFSILDIFFYWVENLARVVLYIAIVISVISSIIGVFSLISHYKEYKQAEKKYLIKYGEI